mgnify:CR=1 FL=1
MLFRSGVILGATGWGLLAASPGASRSVISGFELVSNQPAICRSCGCRGYFFGAITVRSQSAIVVATSGDTLAPLSVVYSLTSPVFAGTSR